MRVFHLYSGNMFGGVERFLLTLAQQHAHCPSMQHTFALCFEAQLAGELRQSNAAVEILSPVRFSRPWTITAARRKLQNLLRRDSFDVAITHSCWPHAIFAPVVRKSGIPLVFWPHDVPTGTHWIERWAKRTAPDLILANSRFTASAVPLLFPRSPVEIQHLPVALPQLQNKPEIRQKIRTEFATHQDATVILTVGRLERCKGQDVLLQALGNLRDLPNWVCWIVGGVQRPDHQKFLDELTAIASNRAIDARVRFIGARSDVTAIMAAADLYCQPNTGPESFGLTFIEALNAGLPVVTSAFGGAVDIVDDSCGRLVAPSDMTALQEQLRMLVNDPALRRILGEAGPRRAEQICNPGCVLRDLESKLTQLLNAQGEAVGATSCAVRTTVRRTPAEAIQTG